MGFHEFHCRIGSGRERLLGRLIYKFECKLEESKCVRKFTVDRSLMSRELLRQRWA